MDRGHTAPQTSAGSPTLVSARVALITNAIPEQCTLLAQTIAQVVPALNGEPISKEDAIAKLLAITEISQENELLIITPVSVKVKNSAAGDVASVSPLFLKQRREQILLALYENKQSQLFKSCIDKLVEAFCTLPDWQQHKDLRPVHPALIRFIERLRQQREDEEIAAMQKLQIAAFSVKGLYGEW